MAPKRTYKKRAPKIKAPQFNQDVENKIKILVELQKKHDDLNDLIVSEYKKIPVPPRNVMEMIEALPLQNINDVYNHVKGKGFSLFKAMTAKDKIFKKNQVRQDELDSLKRQIEIAKIDVAMAKVNSLLGNFP